jgi:branched-chain amino acid transport system substrate-binding protein
MTFVRPVIALACAATIGALDASCGMHRDVHGVAARDTLYVGVAAARANVAYFRGVQLALDKLNSERPSGTPPFAIRLPGLVQPSQVAVAAAFRNDPSVIGVVGHTGSAQTMDAAPVYGDVADGGKHALVAITPTATNPLVTRVSRWVFRVCPTDDDAARALARFAIDSLHVRRLAIVYRNDLFGRGFTHTIAPELDAAHVGVAERDPYLAGITEYQAYATRMAREGIQAVVFAGGGVDAADFIRALHDVSAHPAILGSDDVGNILDGVKAVVSSEKTLARTRRGRRARVIPPPTDDRDLFRGVRYTSFFDPDRSTDGAAREFAATFAKRYGQPASQQAALSYDAAMLIGRAALAVGSDRARIRDWIASIGVTAPPMHGVTGEIRFDENGDAVAKPVVIGLIAP